MIDASGLPRFDPTMGEVFDAPTLNFYRQSLGVLGYAIPDIAVAGKIEPLIIRFGHEPLAAM